MNVTSLEILLGQLLPVLSHWLRPSLQQVLVTDEVKHTLGNHIALEVSRMRLYS